MKNINWKKEALILIILILPFIYAAFIWNKLPEQVPVRFNLKGEPDDYSRKSFALLMMPGMNILVYLLLFFIPRIDPRYKNYSLFGSSYQNIRLIVHLFVAGVFVYITQITMSGHAPKMNGFFAVMFLFFALLGNYFRTVRSNWFVGIRTPWTLSSDIVWKKTHELGGKIWFFAGLVGAIIVMFLPETVAPFFLGASVFVMALVPVVYSYFEYQKVIKLPKDAEHTSQQ